MAWINSIFRTVTSAARSASRAVASSTRAVTRSAPKITIPRRITVPKITLPKITVPRITIPKITIPKITAPKITVPKVAIPKITIPKITAPKITVPKVAIPKITAPKLVIPAVAAAGAAALLTGKIPQVSLPKLPTLPALPKITTPRVTLPTLPKLPTAPLPSKINPLPDKSGRNVVDEALKFRNDTYDTAGEEFAKGVRNKNTGQVIAGAGTYAGTAAIDAFLPLDALGVGNKIATGRAGQITQDEMIGAGIDAGLAVAGLFTGGAAYVGGKAALKAGKMARAAAAAKSAAGAVKRTAGAAVTAAAKTGGGGSAMVKTGSLVRKMTGALKRISGTKPKAAKKITPKTKVSAPRKTTTATRRTTTSPRKTTKITSRKTTTATRRTTTTKPRRTTTTAPKKTTATASKKTTAKTQTTTPKKTTTTPKKTTMPSTTPISKAKLVGTGLLAGATGIGLLGYLAGGSDSPNPDLTAEGTGEEFGGIGNAELPLDGEVTDTGAYEDQMGAIDQAVEDGQITPEEGEALKDQLIDKNDIDGGNFPAAVGGDTPYQEVENAAQDLTREIPGDPLEWFRQNGLAAPALAIIALVIIAAIWYVWKHYVKKGHTAGKSHRRAAPAGKQVVVM